jgi:uncharacterized protein (TIGR03435 family)
MMLFLQHCVIATLAVSGQAFAQTFDAASVKPFDPDSMRTAPPEERRAMGTISGTPGSTHFGRLHYPGATLQALLLEAYGVNKFQLQGPDWLSDGALRFNVDATFPTGTTKLQFRAMLRNLLAERFHLAAHSEKKEVSGYALTAMKGKLKIKESTDPPAPANGGEPVPLKLGADRFLIPPDRQGVFFQLVGTGAGRASFRQVTMQELAATLQNQLKLPVEDAAGLTAKYDFALIYATLGLDLGTGRIPVGPAVSEDRPPDIFAAVREQLGLRLDAKKISAEIIIIDHIDKTPTGN